MTYLELCQAVIEEVGLSGEIGQVTGQKGDFARVSRFVKTACQQLEGRWLNWRFCHKVYNFTTINDVNIYPAPEGLRVRQWDIYQVFLNGFTLPAFHADDFRYRKIPAAENFSGRPIFVVAESDNSLRFVGTPDGAYDIEINYWQQATVLVNNDDMPAIPPQFQEAIVFDAVRRYANYDEAAELKQQAIEQLYGVNGSWARPEPGSLLFQLQADQLPNTEMNGATQDGYFEVRSV